MGRREFDVAIVEYQRALAVDPNHRNAKAGLGVALQKVGRYLESSRLLEQVLPSPNTDNDSTLPQELALAYVALGREQQADTLLHRYYPASLVSQIKETIRIRLTNLPRPVM